MDELVLVKIPFFSFKTRKSKYIFPQQLGSFYFLPCIIISNAL